MNIVLFGGNGYIGRNFIQKVLDKFNDVNIYVFSRSGKNELKNPKIKNVKVDVSDINQVRDVFPDNIDVIVDFVGALGDDIETLERLNLKPAEVMLKIADEKNVAKIAYIGAILGSKDFTKTKSKVINLLKSSKSELIVVEPTLVYGNGRDDKLSKLVPLFKFLGIFSKNFKPVHVDSVCDELIDKIF